MQTDIPLETHRLRITHDVGMHANALAGLLQDAAALLAGIDVDRTMFQEAAAGVFSYRIWHLDGRVWRQTITFAGAFDDDPDMSFDVNPGWRLTEFTAMRAWRTACVNLRNTHAVTVLRLDPN